MFDGGATPSAAREFRAVTVVALATRWPSALVCVSARRSAGVWRTLPPVSNLRAHGVLVVVAIPEIETSGSEAQSPPSAQLGIATIALPPPCAVCMLWYFNVRAFLVAKSSLKTLPGAIGNGVIPSAPDSGIPGSMWRHPQPARVGPAAR
jgi:hypothetical protein